MKIYLIRHGKPKIVDNDFYRCHLSEEGINQTKKLATSGIIPKPSLKLSSPYNRAKDTAKAFCDVFEMGFTVKDFLKEWNLQSLNLQEEYAEQEELGWKDQGKVVQGGESLNDVKDRITKGIEKLVKQFNLFENIMLVSHGTIIDMFCSSILGRNAELSDIKSMNYLEFAIIEFRDGIFTVVKDVIKP